MRRGLGLGLSRLIGEEPKPKKTKGNRRKTSPAPKVLAPAEPATKTAPPGTIAIELIQANRRQPRQKFDESALQELAASIREFGILQPLIVRPIADSRFELIAGERRFRAAKLAGLEFVPVVSRASDNQATLEIALIENIQREDIGPIECARAYEQLSQEFALTQEQIAARVGKSRTAVTNTMRLLRLPQKIQNALMDGSVTEGQVRPLVGLESDADRLKLFERIVELDLSARQVEQILRDRATKPQEKQEKPVNAEWKSVERGLSTFLGAKATLQRKKKGGRLTVSFQSDSDLTRILDVLGFRLDS